MCACMQLDLIVEVTKTIELLNVDDSFLHTIFEMRANMSDFDYMKPFLLYKSWISSYWNVNISELEFLILNFKQNICLAFLKFIGNRRETDFNWILNHSQYSQK